MNTYRASQHVLVSDGADVDAEAARRLSALLAQHADVDGYQPPTYPYHPHIRLRRYE